MKYTLQDKTGKETASVSFENGNVISLSGSAKVKDEAVSQEGYKPNVQSVKDMNGAQNALYEVFKAAIANKTIDDIKHGTVDVFPRKSLKNNKLVLGTFKIRMNLFNKNNISFKTVSKWFSEFKKSQEKKMRKFLKSYYKENQITFNGLFFEMNSPNDKLSEGGYIYTNLDSIKFSGNVVKASESMNIMDAIFETI